MFRPSESHHDNVPHASIYITNLHNNVDHMAMQVGEPEATTDTGIHQPFMIESNQVSGTALSTDRATVFL